MARLFRSPTVLGDRITGTEFSGAVEMVGWKQSQGPAPLAGFGLHPMRAAFQNQVGTGGNSEPNPADAGRDRLWGAHLLEHENANAQRGLGLRVGERSLSATGAGPRFSLA